MNHSQSITPLIADEIRHCMRRFQIRILEKDIKILTLIFSDYKNRKSFEDKVNPKENRGIVSKDFVSTRKAVQNLLKWIDPSQNNFILKEIEHAALYSSDDKKFSLSEFHSRALQLNEILEFLDRTRKMSKNTWSSRSKPTSFINADIIVEDEFVLFDKELILTLNVCAFLISRNLQNSISRTGLFMQLCEIGLKYSEVNLPSKYISKLKLAKQVCTELSQVEKWGNYENFSPLGLAIHLLNNRQTS